MKKTILFTFIGASLILTGCVQQTPTANQNDNQLATNANQDSNQRTVTESASSLTSLNETWNLYTNNEYGFSIQVPKQMYHGYGAMCEWRNDSYRPAGGMVPVNIFEDENIYIAGKYFYELTGKTEKNNIHYYSECNEVTNTLAHLENNTYNQQQSWEIIIRTINNDDELENFIKNRYGNGCELGNLNDANQAGVYDVSIQGDGKNLSETECPLNYLTVLKYYPGQNKVVSWNIGQAVTFAGDNNYQSIYDQAMIDSFQFE